MIGAMSDGSKEILAIEPGYRESTESWLTVLRDLRDRGLEHPVLIAADGNMGIWAARSLLQYYLYMSGEPVPFDSLGIVFRYALALVVHDPDVELALRRDPARQPADTSSRLR